MIGLRSADLLASLQSNLEELRRMTPHVGADGYFLFVRDAHGPGGPVAAVLAGARHRRGPGQRQRYGMLGAYLVVNGLLPDVNGRTRLHGYQAAA